MEFSDQFKSKYPKLVHIMQNPLKFQASNKSVSRSWNPSDVILSMASKKESKSPTQCEMTTFEMELEKLKKKNIKCMGYYLNHMERELNIVIIDEICKIIFLFADYLDERLVNFRTTAANGVWVMKHSGVKNIKEPKEKLLKVLFNNRYRAKTLTWGSGSRYIDFSEIESVVSGHWTPVFHARKDDRDIDPDFCFSVIGKYETLDVEMYDKELVSIWVSGLRLLLNESNSYSFLPQQSDEDETFL